MCYGNSCYDKKIKHNRELLTKYNGKNYCEKCLKNKQKELNTRKNVDKMIKRVFEIDKIPLHIKIQLNKHIKDDKLTLNGVFNTLCYLYFESNEPLSLKYGLYPIIKNYDEHKEYIVELSEIQNSNKQIVHTSLQPQSNNVIKSIDKVRLNDNE